MNGDDTGPNWCETRWAKFYLIGDSLTQRSFEVGGWGARLYNHYCRKADVVNRGFGGYNTRWFVKYLPCILDEIKYSREKLIFVTLFFGANDSLHLSSGWRQFVSREEYYQDLMTIARNIFACRDDKQIFLMLMSPPPVNEQQKIADQLKQYGEKHAFRVSQRTNENTYLYATIVKKVYLELREEFIGQVGYTDVFHHFNDVLHINDKWFCDGLHFSPAGQEEVFQLLLKEIGSQFPQIEYNALVNHFPWHDQLAVNGNFIKSPYANSSDPLILLKNGSTWDWDKEEFVLKPYLAIQNGIFVSLGPEHVLTNHIEIDMVGKYILPGLIDAHVHILMLGESFFNLNLSSCLSHSDIQATLESFMNSIDKDKDDKKGVIGFGWDHEKFEKDGKAFPTSKLIDDIISDRPVIFFRVCQHIACANSFALDLLNKNESQLKQAHNNGILVENDAQIVLALINKYNDELCVQTDNNLEKEKYILAGLNHCLCMGLTQVHTNDFHSFSIYKKLDSEGRLPVRVNLVIPFEELDDVLSPYESLTGLFTCRKVKIFSDGSLGAKTAALRLGSNENLGHSGVLVHEFNKLVEMFKLADSHGFQLETHAIGDAAVDQVIRALECAFGHTLPSKRAQITHCQVMSPYLIARMAANGIIANIQGSFVPSDAKWIESRLDNDTSKFGYDRLAYSYCWKTMLRAGIYLSGSSDAPIEDVSPFKGMHDLLFRPSSHNSLLEVFQPEEKLEFFQCVSLYTNSAAFSNFDDHKYGRIEPGYAADFVVLDVNPRLNPSKLAKINPQQVWINGVSQSFVESNISYGSPQSFLPGKNGPRFSAQCLCHLNPSLN